MYQPTTEGIINHCDYQLCKLKIPTVPADASKLFFHTSPAAETRNHDYVSVPRFAGYILEFVYVDCTSHTDCNNLRRNASCRDVLNLGSLRLHRYKD